MTNWLQTLIQTLQYLWPFAKLSWWERGVYYIWGRKIGEVGRGVWPVIPFFTELWATVIVPDVAVTPLLTITLKDGRFLTYSATAVCQIVDVTKAFHGVNKVTESIEEMLAAITAEFLADVDPDRLDTGSRKRLVNSVVKKLNEEMAFMGVIVHSVRFSNFGIGLRAYRLLTDTALIETGG